MQGKSAFHRWLAFNAVGMAGVILQLGVLAALVHLVGVHYLLATVIAVEAAILHNFVWHQRWTWRDRPVRSRRAAAERLARFHLLNGAVSLVGNFAIVAALTGTLRLDPVAANIVAIATCSFLNFALSHALVFRTAMTTAVAVMIGAGVAWAGPSHSAAQAWKAYEAKVEARHANPSGGFFAQDTIAEGNGWRQAVRAGGVRMASIAAPSLSGAQIHHWVGSVFIPRAQLDDVLARLRQNAGNEAEFYDDVLASRLLAASGDRVSIFMKLRRESVVTVTYNTEHAVEYRRLDGKKATSRSVATKIAELDRAGTPREKEKADGDDNGFLWRLNAYWRYEQLADGVLIECESVSLSRSIPALLRPIASPVVDRIARESLEKTLQGLRSFLVR